VSSCHQMTVSHIPMALVCRLASVDSTRLHGWVLSGAAGPLSSVGIESQPGLGGPGSFRALEYLTRVFLLGLENLELLTNSDLVLRIADSWPPGSHNVIPGPGSDGGEVDGHRSIASADHLDKTDVDPSFRHK
jgi:hypothetical protein